jgi:hypothetical protein
MFKPNAIANLVTVALVVAASNVKNGNKMTQHTDALKNLILQELLEWYYSKKTYVK